MQGLRAVVPCAHRNTVTVEYLCNVMWMDAVKGEGCHASLLGGRRAKDFQTRHLFQSFQRVFDDLMLVSGYFVHADGRKIIHRSTKPDRFCDGRRAGLELGRYSIWAERPQFNFLDHIEIGRAS